MPTTRSSSHRFDSEPATATSRIERIRRALAARAVDHDWETGLRSWCESHHGVSLPTLARELSEALQCDVPLGVLESLREDSYRRDPRVGRALRVQPIRKTARRAKAAA
ncbi:MAG TPA: hypothetical protein VNW46_05390 [Gemmatimonadaceae bacterium]|nr:hypothetical protein [Gemmatimonadaceae bacterium]